ncbi:MAG: succinate dehydrogenase [Desulfurococcales archaeon]|nr:succinate dehydrogenase [Desulfurococcales archaeon]
MSEGTGKVLPNRPGWLASVNPWVLRVVNNPERLAFVLHRLTGLLMALIIMAHIFVTGTPARVGWEAWAEEIAKAQGITVVTLYFFFFAGIAWYHGLNGIRLLLVEFFGTCIGKPEKPKPPYLAPSLKACQRKLLYTVYILWAILWILTGYIVFMG